MAERASRAGAALCRHAKTHKPVELARLQRSHGVAGVPVAPLRGAELPAADGLCDIRLAYPPVGESCFARLVSQARRARVRT